MCRLTSFRGPDAKDGAAVAASASRSATVRFLILLADVLLFAIYVPGYVGFRIAELVVLASSFPVQCASTAAAGLLLLRVVPVSNGSRPCFPRRHLVTVALLAALTYLTDVALPSPIPMESARGKTVVITGANSGIGYETARALAVEGGSTVVLGCRNEGRCADAANRINSEAAAKGDGVGGKAVPVVVDLSSFDSVRDFASTISSLGLKVDALFNNAGYAPPTGAPTNAYGLDPAFTSMHLSHHLLTELLLRDHPATLKRIVNTSSGTHHLCAIPFAYLPPALLRWMDMPQLPGCVNESFLWGGIHRSTDGAAYIQSKIANVMHAYELPRRHRDGGVEGAAIDLGWVGTSIQPFMQGNLSPTSLGWMRSAEVGIIPVLHALLGPMNDNGEKRPAAEGGVAINVLGKAERPFSYPWWTEDGQSGENVGPERMEVLAGKLWDRSNELLRKNEALR